MVWTAPMTFVPNRVLTAAQLNTHLRDNLLETEVGKAANASGYFVAAGAGQIAERVPKAATVGTAESTDAVEWTDLATAGPEVTVTTGTRAFVFIYGKLSNSTANSMAAMNWAVSGATERDPIWDTALAADGLTAANGLRFSNVDLISTLNPGENTFTMKYKVGSGTGTFDDRRIAVLPF